MREATVAASLLIDVVGYLGRCGVPAPDICQALGVSETVLTDPDARLPGSLVERLWAEGERRTGDPSLGLHTADEHNPGALNILGYVLLSCRTAAQALGRLARYAALLNEGLRIEIENDGDRTACRFEAVPGLDNYLARSPRQVMEAMAAGVVIVLRRVPTAPVAPLAVSFRHAAPDDVSEHARVFRVVPAFSAARSEVVFRSRDLDTGLLSANPALLQLLEAQASRLLEHLHQHGPVARRIVTMLATRLEDTVPPLAAIAGMLAMSERSVQRELRREGTSYRALVDGVRREIALQQLATPGTSAGQVAFLLGFSEPSAFTRAFRRWTGGSPSAYRRAARRSEAPFPADVD